MIRDPHYEHVGDHSRGLSVLQAYATAEDASATACQLERVLDFVTNDELLTPAQRGAILVKLRMVHDRSTR